MGNKDIGNIIATPSNDEPILNLRDGMVLNDWFFVSLFKKCKYKDFESQILKIREEDEEFDFVQANYYCLREQGANDKMLVQAKKEFAEELIDSIQARFTLMSNTLTHEEMINAWNEHINKMEKRKEIKQEG